MLRLAPGSRLAPARVTGCIILTHLLCCNKPGCIDSCCDQGAWYVTWSTYLGTTQTQVQKRVQAAAGGEHNPVGVLPVQHQLCGHQIHLHNIRSLIDCRLTDEHCRGLGLYM